MFAQDLLEIETAFASVKHNIRKRIVRANRKKHEHEIDEIYENAIKPIKHAHEILKAGYYADYTYSGEIRDSRTNELIKKISG